MKTLVVALGGNALLQRGEALTAENQYRNIASAVPALARLARSYRLAIVHGNGPQVGLLALQNLAWKEVEPYPLDVLVAESQGMTIVVVTHELASINAIADRAVMLDREAKGIIATGAPAELAQHPDARVRRFFLREAEMT